MSSPACDVCCSTAPSPPDATREILEQLLTALASSQTDVYTVARIISPLRPTNVADYRHVAFWQRLRYFCRLYLQSSQELHRLQSGVDDRARLPRTHPAWLVIPITPKLCGAGCVHILYVDDDWRMELLLRNGMPVPML
ncbi:hypothetical protein O5264_13200 [Escherichia coli]|nr:hypothetical protein [Escherichia coli]